MTKTKAIEKKPSLLTTVQQVASQHTGDPPDVWSVEQGQDGFRVMRQLSGSYTLIELESFCAQMRTIQERVTLVTGEQGDSEARREFVRLAPRVGIPPDAFGVVFRSEQSGSEYKAIGIKPGRSRYPIICERVPDGKKFKFPVHAVRVGVAEAKAVTRG